MREIIFRGKRTDNGDWVEGCYLFEDGRTYIHPESGRCPDVNPETIGQYTGLKDKNGNRIFEGDAVRCPDGQYTVIYSERYACFQFAAANSMEFYLLKYFDNPLEIIGNIHDNPELLEP